MCVAALAAVAALPAGASASKASLQAALSSETAQIATAEANVKSAIEQYAASKEAAPVVTAVTGELGALRSLRTTVKAQKVGDHPLVRFGKAEVLAGLKSLIAAYEHLGASYASAAVAPKVAVKQYKAFELSIVRAAREMARGEKALSH
jgi:hypothetical protein